MFVRYSSYITVLFDSKARFAVDAVFSCCLPQLRGNGTLALSMTVSVHILTMKSEQASLVSAHARLDHAVPSIDVGMSMTASEDPTLLAHTLPSCS